MEEEFCGPELLECDGSSYPPWAGIEKLFGHALGSKKKSAWTNSGFGNAPQEDDPERRRSVSAFETPLRVGYSLSASGFAG